MKRATTTAGLTALMIASVLAVAALAYWDEQRESSAALEDFAQEQATLAKSVADEVEARLATAPDDHAVPRASLLAGVAHLERPNMLSVVVESPDGRLFASDGRGVDAPEIMAALAGGRPTLRLTGAQAGIVGLPERTAMAGLAHFGGGALGRWGVAVVASAERERDRERWARVRVLLATTVAAGLVLGFGGHAVRRQRKQLELEHALQVSELERERDERLARLSKAATMVTLASGVAHEISTPLGVISGRAEQLMERPDADERQRQAAGSILGQVQRIKDVVRGFLDVARGGAPILRQLAPTDIAETAIALVAHRLEKAGVRLVRSVQASLPAVRCDPTLLEHALVNLLLNACDACVRGGTVELAAAVERGELVFAVTDDGEGIAEVNVARAAEPFFTTKPRGQGTGLGLSVVSEIAKCHRGSFSIEPAQPRGTRACIQVPIQASAA